MVFETTHQLLWCASSIAASANGNAVHFFEVVHELVACIGATSSRVSDATRESSSTQMWELQIRDSAADDVQAMPPCIAAVVIVNVRFCVPPMHG